MPSISRRGVHFYVPMASHLDGDMSRRSEAIESQPSPGPDPRKPQRSKSNNPRTQERRGLLIGKSFRNRVSKTLGGNDVLCISSVYRVTGKLRRVAQVLRSR